jgi:type VII secretion integral membrane protein EccD
MATRFTRLSVVAGSQQLDTSLPASRPVAEFISDLPLLLSLAPTDPPTAWALSAPRYGSIPPERSLDEAGVLDGDVLYLSPRTEAAESPVVDDVIQGIADTVDRGTSPWARPSRDRVTSSLLAVVFLALTATLTVLPQPRTAGLVLIGTFAVAVGVRMALRHRGGWLIGWAGWPALVIGTFLAVHQADLDVRCTLGLTAGLLGLAVLAAVDHGMRAVMVAGVVGGVLFGLASALLAAGVSDLALAAWSAPALVLVLGVTAQLAVSMAGLPGLARQAEAVGAVPRRDLSRAVHVGLTNLDGTIAATGLAGAAAAATLLFSDHTPYAFLGGLLGIAFLLRSRGFSSAYQVGFLLVVPLTALVAAALALPGWAQLSDPESRGALRGAALAVVAILVGIAGHVRLPDVAAAQFARLWDILDMVAVIGVVPMVLLAQLTVGGS